MANEPTTLTEAVIYFSNPDNCLNYLVARRWRNGVVCPTCGSDKVSFLPSRRLWQCKTRHKKAQFSAKIGTIFEDSPLGLDKWLPTLWMLGNCKNGISSHEIARAIGVTQKTAWFMLHRIRLAMQGETGGKLGGQVEVDETFAGGKARNMHKRAIENRLFRENAPHGKAIVFGMLERNGKVRAIHVDSRRKHELQKAIRENIEAGSAIFSDQLLSYDGLEKEYDHEVINHAVEYVNGNVHTNTMENFLESAKARASRNIHQRRTVPSVSLHR